MAVEHIPVLLQEILQTFSIAPQGLFFDGTLGGGGHAEAILKKFKEAMVIGVDRDLEAVRRVEERLAPFKNRARVFCSAFGSLKDVLRSAGVKTVDGMLLDLGMSSYQLADAERGFSFQQTGPLDMRMEREGETLKSRLGNTNVAELASVLRSFGEERLANKIARAILNAFHQGVLLNTKNLADVVSGCFSAHEKNQGRLHPATRTFQALRIWINQELDQLERFLNTAPSFLSPGGQCVILSYHSLEDRMVKKSFKRWECERDFSILTKKPVVPSAEEIEKNPRARSAKMRVLERKAA